MEHFTLDDRKHELLRDKSGSARLGFAAMLKFLSWKSRFPRGLFELPDDATEHLARAGQGRRSTDQRVRLRRPPDQEPSPRDPHSPCRRPFSSTHPATSLTRFSVRNFSRPQRNARGSSLRRIAPTRIDWLCGVLGRPAIRSSRSARCPSDISQVIPPARRAAWWRRSRTSAMSSIRSGLTAAYRAVVRRSTCPSRAETSWTKTPAPRQWVAQ
ncbi:MAG: hypothetical protein ACR2QA_15685 [Solirubrobacteraceae bacterium]